jgi:putative nucleotidyltransferase with HDIG domain
MDTSSPVRPRLRQRLAAFWQASRLGLIFIVSLILATVALVLPIYQGAGTLALDVGDVSSQEVLAPFALTFVSETRTERARQEAAAAVEPVFDRPDGGVAREQIERLRITLEFVESVRTDSFSTAEQKAQDLAALADVRLDPQNVEYILALTDPRWQGIKQETLAVLEQVMSSEIREGQMEMARRAVPALVSISLPEAQAELVTHLATAYVAPNALFNEQATLDAQQAAARSVEPVSATYSAGETIVARGQVVQAGQIEALEAFGLISPPRVTAEIALRALLVTLLGCVIGLYLHRVHRKQIVSARLATVTGIAFILSALALQAMVPNRAVLPYLVPAATLPIVLTTMFSPGMGVVGALATGAIAGFLAPRGLEVGLYVTLSGAVAALVIGRAERISSFFWAGLASSLAAVAVIVLFRFPDPATDLLGKATLFGAGILSGLVSASLAFGLVLLTGSLLGGTSNLQLIDLSRPDHPLLQLILRNAPGTYQHSLQVANLSDQAARAIGANAMLVRVGALYHDVGKALHPQYFIENQVPGQNIHEQLDPATSASLIISHVHDGLALARKNRLPPRIAAFIPEHHGTMQATYQLQAAIASANGDASRVDRREFGYPGPRPRTKESAILMLADGVEAKARAESPNSDEEIEELVRWVVDDRLAHGQLERTDLTLRDLDNIRHSFVRTLKGMYHPRIRYPESVDASDGFSSVPAVSVDPPTPEP